MNSSNPERTYFDIRRELNAEVSTLAGEVSGAFDQSITHLANLIQSGQTANALHELEVFRQSIRTCLEGISALLENSVRLNHEQYLETMVARRELVEQARQAAIIATDDEGTGAMDKCLEGMNEFFTASIADLDPDAYFVL